MLLQHQAWPLLHSLATSLILHTNDHIGGLWMVFLGPRSAALRILLFGSGAAFVLTFGPATMSASPVLLQHQAWHKIVLCVDVLLALSAVLVLDVQAVLLVRCVLIVRERVGLGRGVGR